VDEFCRRACHHARSIVEDDFEVILVNDGSPDDSLQIATELCATNPHLVVVDLSRNFGHHKAMMTGMAHARGELVFLIDCDLEEDPEWLIDFHAKLQTESCDVVYGVQKRRKGDWFERLSGWFFYRIFRWLTRVDLPKNIVVARLMTRQYVQALLQHEEREVFMAGLWVITGFSQSGNLVTKQCRGQTTYTLGKKILQSIDAVTSFSNAPLIGIFFIGFTLSLLSGLYILFLIINWLYLARPPSGWTSVMASVWLFSGFIIAFIGIIGIYLSKVFSESKRRPYTIVRRVHGEHVDSGRK
jgi:putative glycosyltransferase